MQTFAMPELCSYGNGDVSGLRYATAGRIGCADFRGADVHGADLRGAMLCRNGREPRKCEPVRCRDASAGWRLRTGRRNPSMSRIAALACAIAIVATAARASAYPQVKVPLAVPQSKEPSLDPNAPASEWVQATSLALSWDDVRSRPASEPAKAWILTDGRVRSTCASTHRSASRSSAQQHTNDVGQGSDDEVWIDLWPNGLSGYFYQFYATPNGTHYEYSSENTAYSPNWESQGAVHGERLHRDDEDPVRRASQRARRRMEGAIRSLRSCDRRAAGLVVRPCPDAAGTYGNADYAHAGSISSRS